MWKLVSLLNGGKNLRIVYALFSTKDVTCTLRICANNVVHVRLIIICHPLTMNLLLIICNLKQCMCLRVTSPSDKRGLFLPSRMAYVYAGTMVPLLKPKLQEGSVGRLLIQFSLAVYEIKYSRVVLDSKITQGAHFVYL